MSYLPSTSIEDLQTALAGKISTSLIGADNGVAALNEFGLVPVDQSGAGQAFYVAALDSNGKMPSAQLPLATASGTVGLVTNSYVTVTIGGTPVKLAIVTSI